MRPSHKEIALLVVAALVLVIAAKLLEGRSEAPAAEPPVLSSGAVQGERSTSEDLRRCRDLGDAALDDPTCLDGWDANRRRFFGLPDVESEEGSGPTDPFLPGPAQPDPETGAGTGRDSGPPPGREE